MLGLYRPIRYRRHSGLSSGGLWQSRWLGCCRRWHAMANCWEISSLCLPSFHSYCLCRPSIVSVSAAPTETMEGRHRQRRWKGGTDRDDGRVAPTETMEGRYRQRRWKGGTDRDDEGRYRQRRWNGGTDRDDGRAAPTETMEGWHRQRRWKGGTDRDDGRAVPTETMEGWHRQRR